MVLFTGPTSKDCLNMKRRRENLVIILQLQEPQEKKEQKTTKPKNQHTRHMTKTTRTGNMVSAKLLLWKSLELPVLGC